MPLSAENINGDFFWRHVNVGSGCWVWTGFVDSKGYGRQNVTISPKKKVSQGAHRVSWALNVGPIPDGMHILHECDNPICVRPDHLKLGTHAENMRDMALRGRARSGSLGGSDCAARKFSLDQIKRVREMAARIPRAPYSEIGREVGMTGSNARMIALRRTWRSEA